MNIITTTIKSRHSVRNYKEGPISDSTIRDVLTCAGKAPTAMNRQPWLIGVIRDHVLLSQIGGMTDNGKFIDKAAICFAVFGEKAAKYYLEDCSAATENIILALQAHGFGSCWVAGDKKSYAEQVRVLLQVPDHYTLVSLVPAGIPSDIAIAPKKDLKEIAFFDRYTKQ